MYLAFLYFAIICLNVLIVWKYPTKKLFPIYFLIMNTYFLILIDYLAYWGNVAMQISDAFDVLTIVGPEGFVYFTQYIIPVPVQTSLLGFSFLFNAQAIYDQRKQRWKVLNTIVFSI